MRAKRHEFSDTKKAQIFIRDRATCCFSGANLWLLDAPLRPGFQMDWVDHIVPASRGGRADLNNGVCASHLFNSKKRHNSADTLYLFEQGRPTAVFLEIFGLPDSDTQARLARLAQLTEADWFFNRAVGHALRGIHNHCLLDRYGTSFKRTIEYWTKACWRRVCEFQTKSRPGKGYTALESREVVQNLSPQSRNWLRLRDVNSLSEVTEVIENQLTSYLPNFQAWASYFYDAEDAESWKVALEDAEQSGRVSEETLNCLKYDFATWKETES